MSWSFNGSELTVAGDYTSVEISGVDLPPVRGSNVTIPFQTGKVHVRKYFDQRVVSLGIVIVGSSRADLQTNIETLRALFGSRTRGYLVQTMPDASLRRAYAEVLKSISLSYRSDRVARAVVEFTIAEGLFRSSTQYAPAATTIDASPHAMTIVNSGNTEERNAIITLTGPLEDPVITNSTNGVVLTYGAHIANEVIVVINCGAFTALTGATDEIEHVMHSGDPAFMVFNPGSNTLAVTVNNPSTGTIAVTFYPPFL
jgi:hypothetical protein